MEIQDLKRWHWCLIGALLGAALGYVWSTSGTDIEGMKGADAREFERDIALVDRASGKPLISDIVVHPPETTFEGNVNLVTFKRLAKDRQGNLAWIDKRFVAKIPFAPSIPGRVAKLDGLTVESYLAQASALFPSLDFHYGWWLVPRNAMALGAAGGIVLIGGAWPSIVSLLVGAGLAPKREPKVLETRPGKKLSWFKRAEAGRSATRSSPANSNANAARVQSVADQYERDLAAGATASTNRDVPPGAASADSPTELIKLDAGPLEEAKPIAKPGDDDEVEVKGEYYPVLIHHKKESAGEKP